MDEVRISDTSHWIGEKIYFELLYFLVQHCAFDNFDTIKWKS